MSLTLDPIETLNQLMCCLESKQPPKEDVTFTAVRRRTLFAFFLGSKQIAVRRVRLGNDQPTADELENLLQDVEELLARYREALARATEMRKALHRQLDRGVNVMVLNSLPIVRDLHDIISALDSVLRPSLDTLAKMESADSMEDMVMTLNDTLTTIFKWEGSRESSLAYYYATSGLVVPLDTIGTDKIWLERQVEQCLSHLAH